MNDINYLFQKSPIGKKCKKEKQSKSILTITIGEKPARTKSNGKGNSCQIDLTNSHTRIILVSRIFIFHPSTYVFE